MCHMAQCAFRFVLPVRYVGSARLLLWVDREARTRTCLLRLGEDGVIDCEVVAGTEASGEDAAANVRAVRALIGEAGRASVLVDMRGTKAVSRAAREYYEGDDCTKVIAAAALLVESPLSRAIGNFFIRVTKTKVQLKLFSSASEARTWLLTLR